MANHRLKSFLSLQNRTLTLNLTNLDQCAYTESAFQFRTGPAMQTLTGQVTGWSGAAHSATNDPRLGLVSADSWTVGAGAEERRFELTSVFPATTGGLFVRQAEIRKRLSVCYATPMPTLSAESRQSTTTAEEVQLVAAPDLASLAPGLPESFSSTNGVQLKYRF